MRWPSSHHDVTHSVRDVFEPAFYGLYARGVILASLERTDDGLLAERLVERSSLRDPPEAFFRDQALCAAWTCRL
jgi:hypothetical protein